MTLEISPTYNRIPIPRLSINKLGLLEKSTSDPRFYVLIESGNVVDDVVYYEIEICIQQENSVVLNRITRRYSQIEKFHQVLKKSLDSKTVLPKLPPKKLFGNTNAEFVKERKEALQMYFDSLDAIPGMLFQEVFQVFFEMINMNQIQENSETYKRIEQERMLMNLR